MEDEEQLFNWLDSMGCEPVDRGNYYLIHCPMHDDRNKSAQCFKDGWVACHAGCPRTHVNKLAGQNLVRRDYSQTDGHTEHVATVCDFTDFWLQFEPVRNDIKQVPANELNKRGWRDFPGGWGMRPGVFIPYFNTRRDKVIYYQIRHLEGDRRFTFAKGCSPAVYGLEQLGKMGRYLTFTEGSRDSVILGMAGIPAVALPTASSGAHLRKMESYAKQNGKILVCAGDRDEAGDKLIANLTGPYIDARTPVGKDVGDLYEKEGLEGVKKYYEQYKS